MPQVSYLVRSQVYARLSDQSTGFNYWLGQAIESQAPQPPPFTIDWSSSSKNFWNSYVSAEQLDETTAVADGTICMVHGVGLANQTGTVVKFAVFSGTVDIAVEFDLAWPESYDPNDSEGLADAVDDAMIQTFNAAQFYGAFSGGVLWNGLIRVERGQMRESGEGWRQRLAYTLTFEVQV